MITPDVVDPLEVLSSLNWEESQELEFKSAKGGLPKSLWQTYSAMANTHGGIILLGVEDNGAVSGVVNSGKLKKAFWDTVNNRGKVSANLLMDTDVADITRILQGLVAKGVLMQEGQARGSRYRLPFVEFDTACVSDSLHNVDFLFNDLSSLLNRIAEPAKKKRRLAPKEMECLILELCTDQWLSRKQLSELLNRNPESLLSRFLTPMVDHGLLVMKFPDKPNRIDQAYQATGDGIGELK